MLELENLIRQTLAKRPDTVIHVGAGRGEVLEQYRHLSPSRVVLIEGDPEASVALKRAAQRYPWAEVMAQSVSCADGSILWHRYNLPMLNGPLAADSLINSYPRLRRKSIVTVQGVSLSSLLMSVLQTSSQDDSTVLVLDVPGQEGGLLEPLESELDALTAVVVRRCASSLTGAKTWRTVEQKMQDRSFEQTVDGDTSGTLWPVIVFKTACPRSRNNHRPEKAHLTEESPGTIEKSQNTPEQKSDKHVGRTCHASAKTDRRKARTEPLKRGSILLPGQAAHASLDKLLSWMDLGAASPIPLHDDQTLILRAKNCLKHMLNTSDCAELTIDRVATSSGPLNLMHIEGDYIPTKIVHEQKFYELQFLETLAKFHQAGSLVVDVGANIGNHSVYFAQTIGSKVAAVEPQPHNMLCLEMNMRLNGIHENVTVHRCALGKSSGTVALEMSIDANYGSFSAAPDSDPSCTTSKGINAYKVPVKTLDSLLESNHPDHEVSLIKIDVEGMELDVLQGAIQTIERWLPAIACECLDLPTFEKLESFFTKYGYSIVGIYNSTPTLLFCNLQKDSHLMNLSRHLRDLVLSNVVGRKGFVRNGTPSEQTAKKADPTLTVGKIPPETSSPKDFAPKKNPRQRTVQGI